MRNPTLRPEHLENRMLATTPISSRGRSQTAHQRSLSFTQRWGMRKLSRRLQNALFLPLSGNKKPTRVSVFLLDWEGALFPQEGRVIVWTEWL